MPKDVFISCSSEDQALAQKICRALEERSIGCWIAPRDILPGASFDEAILDAIDHTQALVLILSDHSNISPFVKNEVSRAFAKRKAIFTFRVQDVLPAKALEFFLARCQWTDGFPLAEPKIGRLAAAIRGLVGRTVPTENKVKVQDASPLPRARPWKPAGPAAGPRPPQPASPSAPPTPAAGPPAPSRRRRIAGTVLGLALMGTAAFGLLAHFAPPASEPNTLSQSERLAGWRLLFDGATTRGWSAFGGKPPPKECTVGDGCLKLKKSKTGYWIYSAERFDNFEFTCQWRISPNGNSGVGYRVSKELFENTALGLEMQVVDNDEPGNKKIPHGECGALVGLYSPAHDAAHAAGQWNSSRLVADGRHVEHWLNGQKVVDCTLGDKDFLARLDARKNKVPLFWQEPGGWLTLQARGGTVWYRDLKIRPLPAAVTSTTRTK